jgi:hypothetical protein
VDEERAWEVGEDNVGRWATTPLTEYEDTPESFDSPFGMLFFAHEDEENGDLWYKGDVGKLYLVSREDGKMLVEEDSEGAEGDVG